MEGDGDKFNRSLRMNGLSSDLLHKIIKRSRYPSENEVEEVAEDMELSLGLSTNGRFGVDPTKKRLQRSYSISDFPLALGDGTGRHAPLARTNSLPVEAEEEWGRRKEMQLARRMEARKKRMEKLKNGRLMKAKENSREEAINEMGIYIVPCGTVFEDDDDLNGVEDGNVTPSSQEGSTEALKGGSSGNSHLLLYHQIEGEKNQDGEVKPPVPKEEGKRKRASQYFKYPMPDMPFVSTKEAGADGKKVDGFLYRYRTGEDVRIVCVCHGFFLTPADFVKHGGGGNVEEPLKHIVVNPFPFS